MVTGEHELLKDFPVVAVCNLDWADMDAFQHVNNINYFRFFENARIIYGFGMGLMSRMETENIGPILAWTECRYLRPLTFPDTALVGVRSLSIEGSEVLMEYNVVSKTQNVIAAVGKSLGVYYDYGNLKRVDFPEEILSKVDEIECRQVPRKHKAE